jgi:WD40 repeat protein
MRFMRALSFIWVCLISMASSALADDVHQRLAGHRGGVLLLAFSPDGKYLATAGGAGRRSPRGDTAVMIWDVKTGKRVTEFDRDMSGGRSLSFSPDAALLITDSVALGSFEQVVWDIETQSTIARIEGASVARYSPVDNRYVTASETRGVTIYDGDTRKPIARFNPEPERKRNHGIDIAFSHDGKKLAVLTDQVVLVADSATGEEIARRPAPDAKPGSRPVRVHFASDDRVMLGSGRELYFWNYKTEDDDFDVFIPFDRPEWSIRSAVSPDGKTLAVANNTRVTLWDLSTRRQIKEFVGHEGTMYELEFSPDGRYLASGADDSIAYVWNVPTDEDR